MSETAEDPPTTVAVKRSELLALKRLQLAIEETEGRKLSMSQLIRRALDALTGTGTGRTPA